MRQMLETIIINIEKNKKKKKNTMGQLDHPITIVYPWFDDHSTSISVSKVWEAKIGVQVFKRELHTYIYLDLVRVDSTLNKIKKI